MAISQLVPSPRFLNVKYCVAYGHGKNHSHDIISFGNNKFCDIASDNYLVIFPVFMMQTILFLSSSRLIYFLLRPLNQPTVVCNALSINSCLRYNNSRNSGANRGGLEAAATMSFVVSNFSYSHNQQAGILLGPSGLGSNQEFQKKLFPPDEVLVVNTLGIIGGLYYILLETVKMDKERIIRTAKYALNVSITSMVITFLLLTFITRLLQKYVPVPYTETFLGATTLVLSLSCFPVVGNALSELNLLNTELGNLAVSCSILNEITSYVVMVLTIILGTPRHKVESVLCLFAILYLTFFIIRPIILWFIRNIPEGKPVNEIFIVGLGILPMLMGILTDMIGLTFWVGAALIGFVIPPGPPLGSAMVEKCEVINAYIFLPFFYISIGLNVNVYSVQDWKAVSGMFVLLVAPVFGKMFANLISLLYFKTSVRNAMLLSLLLNFRGINDFLLAIRWRRNEVVDEATFTLFVLINMIVTAITGPLIDIYYKPQTALQGSSDQYRSRWKTLQEMAIDTELRVLCGVHCEENVQSIITLLKILNPTEKSPINAHIIHLQELVARTTPLLAPYNHKRKRLLPNSTDRIMRAITNNFESYPFAITLHTYTMIAPYKTMHQNICSLAQDKSIPFIVLPFHRNQLVHESAVDLHSLNNNIQGYSACTVGIFIETGLPHQLYATDSYFHVAVFFIGGPDDREAMALVTRMAEQPNVKINLVRILYQLDYEKEENSPERNFDDYIIGKFLKKNMNNGRVRFREVDAADTKEAIDAIRSTNQDYDLVIVGKRRISGSQLELEMNHWVEYKELGEIGDFLASRDFCQGMMFVLVIHCVYLKNSSVVVNVKGIEEANRKT